MMSPSQVKKAVKALKLGTGRVCITTKPSIHQKNKAYQDEWDKTYACDDMGDEFADTLEDWGDFFPRVIVKICVGGGCFHWFKMSHFPGNCGMIVFHDVGTIYRCRNKGLNTIGHEFREWLAHHANRGLYVCSVNDSVGSAYAQRTLDAADFKSLISTTNPRSGCKITLLAKPIPHKD